MVLLALQMAHAAAPLPAAPPAADAPVVRSGHPRLFLTAAELPALRERIATHYRSEFQAFVNLLDNTASLSSRQKRIEVNWGGFNFAFIAALDPAEMARLGFAFQAPLTTTAAYCERAMSYVRQQLPDVAKAEGQTGGALSTGYPVPKYLSAITTYDWCHAHLADADRRAIVDAYVAAYKKKYEGKNLLTMRVAGRDMLGNDPASNDVEDVLGILAFHGDAYPDARVQRDLLNAFKSIWLDRFLVELDYFYGPGTGWHEGPGGYFSRAFVTLSLPVAMFSPALGVDYVATMPFFSQFPVFVEANTRPNSRERWPYFDRWGVISEGVTGPNCKNLMLSAGMLRRSGHRNAALAKWSLENTVRNCEREVTEYGGTWSNAVLYWFLFGHREIAAQSPASLEIPNSVEFGLGQHVMRSGYTSADSQVNFYAQELAMYGHDTPEYGTFSLHKFGNLIVQAGNTKSGEGVLLTGEDIPSRGSVFENVVGLHKGDSDPGLGFTGGRQPDAFFGARGLDRIGKAGTKMAATLNGRGFDYIGYDSSPMWTGSATVSQREFVYLHGSTDKEFLVVLDRFHATNPASDEKVWKIWVPAQPEFVGGTTATPRPGQWSSSDSQTIKLTNVFSNLKGKDFESAPTHGRFFMKTLLPPSPVIAFLGGAGREFQSGDGDGSTPWGTPPMTQAEREYLGWGRVEVRPSARQAYDVFLNVIQFGDANTLDSMTPVAAVDSADGALTGTHIGDGANQWVVLLARNAAERYDLAQATYRFTPTTARSNHLLVNMARETPFYVTVTSAGGETRVDITTQPAGDGARVMSSDQGVLRFEVNGTQAK
jgi:hypothetical protein